MRWLRNTAGHPDSQLTIQVAWNIIAAVTVLLVAVLSILQDRQIPETLWLFMLGAMGIQTMSYVKRRGQDVMRRPDEEMAG